MVKKKSQSEELFFVQVREPTEARRYILETLKEIVELLHRFEKFRHLRHEKISKINHMRVLIKQANKMLGDLRAKLPQTNLRASAVREAPQRKVAEKKQKAKIEKKQEKPQKREMTELEKLEAELSSIEVKLKSLT
ncbi:hypothetical protein HYX02_07290 [Candidatus Woesearchaeota archaeon]|nr:hypothetical protein [Candidatus Woesearchaeota archaeon]